MDQKTSKKSTTSNRLPNGQNGIRVQHVKNYDATSIDENENKKTKNILKSSQQTKANDVGKVEKTNNSAKKSTSLMSSKTSMWTKTLVCTTYLAGATSLLYFLQNFWIMLGLVGLAVPLLLYFLAKDKTLKVESGKVTIIVGGSTVLSMLFWVLYLTTRNRGIGFLLSLFRGLQITSAVIGTVLVVYYFLEYITNGKISIPWLTRLSQKTETKIGEMKAAKVKH